MRVRITQGVMMNQVPLAPGDIHDLQDHEALYLIGGNRAVVHHEPPEPQVEEVHETEAPAVEAAIVPSSVEVPDQVPAEKVTAKKSKKTEK